MKLALVWLPPSRCKTIWRRAWTTGLADVGCGALDRPLTDLHDTEGTGGFLGAYFMARPVIGGHFAYVALDRACGGKAIEGLAFLEEKEEGKSETQFVNGGEGQNVQDEL